VVRCHGTVTPPTAPKMAARGRGGTSRSQPRQPREEAAHPAFQRYPCPHRPFQARRRYHAFHILSCKSSQSSPNARQSGGENRRDVLNRPENQWPLDLLWLSEPDLSIGTGTPSLPYVRPAVSSSPPSSSLLQRKTTKARACSSN